MIASLAMYDFAQLRAPADRFWASIRDNLRASGVDAPDKLERNNPYWEVWESPDLLFSQTCGRPFRLQLADKVSLAGTPDYSLKDCPAGYYRSAFVVRACDDRMMLTDYENTVFAYNENLSQSGWAAAQCHAKSQGFQFENIWQSGGHAKSTRAVAEGRADIAAIDNMTWELVKRYEDYSLNLRVVEWTKPTPGLPYITGKNIPKNIVFTAIYKAIESLNLHDRLSLLLHDLVEIPASAYLAVPNP